MQLTSVLSDNGFKLHTAQASRALETAKTLLQYTKLEPSQATMKCFSDWLISSLQKCCTLRSRGYRSQHLRREKMCEKYYKFTSSSEHREKWNALLKTAGCVYLSPIFYQRVTDILYKETILRLIEEDQPVDSAKEAFLTFEGKNALYFTAGYLPRALKKKLSKSAHPYKENLICCLSDMIDCVDDEADDDDNVHVLYICTCIIYILIIIPIYMYSHHNSIITIHINISSIFHIIIYPIC